MIWAWLWGAASVMWGVDFLVRFVTGGDDVPALACAIACLAMSAHYERAER